MKRREEKVRELKWREGAVTRKKKGRGENRKKVEERSLTLITLRHKAAVAASFLERLPFHKLSPRSP